MGEGEKKVRVGKNRKDSGKMSRRMKDDVLRTGPSQLCGTHGTPSSVLSAPHLLLSQLLTMHVTYVPKMCRGYAEARA